MTGRKSRKGEELVHPSPSSAEINPVSQEKTQDPPGRENPPQPPTRPPRKPTGAAAHKKPHGKGGGISKRPGKPDPDNHKPGRPPGISDKVVEAIIENVELLGMAESRAGMAEGFSEGAVSTWKDRGEKSLKGWDTLTVEEQAREAPYVRLFKGLRDADPKFERSNLLVIQNSAVNGDWRAANRRLEIKYPDRYGKKFQVGGDPLNPTPIATKAMIYLPDNGRDPDKAKTTGSAGKK